MQTQIMNDTATEPWLEFFPPGRRQPVKTPLAPLPFVLGRSEDCNYPINSGRVSREHARIDRDEQGYRIDDLGSTNGTFVNGERIETARLADGDVVVIADVELTFCTGGVSEEVLVTQVMQANQSGVGKGQGAAGPPRLTGVPSPEDLLAAVRGLQHAVTCRNIPLWAQPVVQLAERRTVGYEIYRELRGPIHRETPRKLWSTECRLNERLQSLYRQLAAESARGLDEDALIFIRLESFEIGRSGLADQLQQLGEQLAPRQRLVVVIPDAAVCDIPYFRSFHRALGEGGILLAYEGFAGGGTQIAEHREIPADFLKLSPALVRGIARSSGGQRQLQLLVQASQELATQLIAPEIEDPGVVEILIELGCGLGQGVCLGPPQLVDELVSEVVTG